MSFCKVLIVILGITIDCKCNYFYPRVLYGRNATKEEYPFVVSLQSRIVDYEPELYRICTGSLISYTCVLTAAHCLIPDVYYVRYGDMTVSRNETKSLRKVLKMTTHPRYRNHAFSFYREHDIGLAFIQKTDIQTFGRVSAISYETLVGLPVIYAGYGITTFDDLVSEFLPLQIGEGVIKSCLGLDFSTPVICTAPKCDSVLADAASGDSGGPLFSRGQIVGLVCCEKKGFSIYTPVSPYLDWIRLNMLQEV